MLAAVGCSSDPSRIADSSLVDSVGDAADTSSADTDPNDIPGPADGEDADAATDGSSLDEVSPADTSPDSEPDTADSDTPADSGDGSADLEVGPSGCTAGELSFVDLPEASGAVALGADHDLLVADSGHLGRALVLDRSLGTAAPLVLPLGEGAGDDVEGLTLGPTAPEELGPVVWGLSSSGYLRAWRVQRSDSIWTATLIHGPVPIGEPGEWVGGPNAVNAGGNFEGICLHPAPTPGACAGWAASKARGELVCLRAVDGSYRLDPEVRLPAFDDEHLSDCAFEAEPPHRLFAAGNVYSGDRVIEVPTDGSTLPPPGRLDALAGAPNQEAILVRNVSGTLEIQSFGDWQDLAGDRSPRVVITCRP